MKIVICTKKDLAACLALNRLLDGLAGRHDVFVVLSDYVLEAEKADGHAARLVAHERDMVLDHVFPFLDRLYPDGSSAACATYAGLQARYGVSMELWGPMRLPQARDAMRDIAPDVIISCRYDYVFQEDVLALPRLGTYGLHPGALPALQGLCSPFRAMQRGDRRSGCTLFHLDSGLDTGPVVEIGWADVAYDRSVLWNFVQTYFAGIDTLMRHLPTLEQSRRLPARAQDPARRQYFTYPTEEEFREFSRRGGHLVLPGDYLELLSWFLPDGLRDAQLPALEKLVSSVAH
ncbi:formyltransferase family protein [Nitratidesulfovibrio sp. 1201_IL3209]|uniref:formyltransferase family protein n=1 Tax=Nitratidesulfovibrio sp. 1201_IL3209 TaxID=3084053 RepID=UPI002FD993E3